MSDDGTTAAYGMRLKSLEEGCHRDVMAVEEMRREINEVKSEIAKLHAKNKVLGPQVARLDEKVKSFTERR